MKARIAQWIVRWVSRWWTAAYQANERGMPRWEDMWARGAKRAERIGLPVACRLDYEATGQQMIEECWWG